MIAIPATTCVVLYGGALRAGLGRTRAALLAGGAAVLLGGWLTASAVIADHGWCHTQLGHGVPWMPVATVGFFGALLALRRIPAVARALTAPGTASRLECHPGRRAGRGSRDGEGTETPWNELTGWTGTSARPTGGAGDQTRTGGSPIWCRRLPRERRDDDEPGRGADLVLAPTG